MPQNRLSGDAADSGYEHVAGQHGSLALLNHLHQQQALAMC